MCIMYYWFGSHDANRQNQLSRVGRACRKRSRIGIIKERLTLSEKMCAARLKYPLDKSPLASPILFFIKKPDSFAAARAGLPPIGPVAWYFTARPRRRIPARAGLFY